MTRDDYLQAMGIDVWHEQGKINSTAPLTTSEETITIVLPAAEINQQTISIAEQWEQVEKQAKGCIACGLQNSRTHVVFGVGNRNADLLIIGEAPGAQEDKQGEPFVGRAGQLLNNMLKAMGLKREEIYIANILKCRPPNNRDPKPEEVALCTPFLAKQIELLQPKIILAVGRIAAHFLLNNNTAMAQLRGKIFTYGTQQIPLIITYHPAYLLRAPTEKRKAWQDLKLLQTFL